jgi:hypothetical protein
MCPPSNAIPVPINVKKGTHGTKIKHHKAKMILTSMASGGGPIEDCSNTVLQRIMPTGKIIIALSLHPRLALSQVILQW